MLYPLCDDVARTIKVFNVPPHWEQKYKISDNPIAGGPKLIFEVKLLGPALQQLGLAEVAFCEQIPIPKIEPPAQFTEEFCKGLTPEQKKQYQKQNEQQIMVNLSPAGLIVQSGLLGEGEDADSMFSFESIEATREIIKYCIFHRFKDVVPMDTTRWYHLHPAVEALIVQRAVVDTIKYVNYLFPDPDAYDKQTSLAAKVVMKDNTDPETLKGRTLRDTLLWSTALRYFFYAGNQAQGLLARLPFAIPAFYEPGIPRGAAAAIGCDALKANMGTFIDINALPSAIDFNFDTEKFKVLNVRQNGYGTNATSNPSTGHLMAKSILKFTNSKKITMNPHFCSHIIFRPDGAAPLLSRPTQRDKEDAVVGAAKKWIPHCEAQSSTIKHQTDCFELLFGVLELRFWAASKSANSTLKSAKDNQEQKNRTSNLEALAAMHDKTAEEIQKGNLEKFEEVADSIENTETKLKEDYKKKFADVEKESKKKDKLIEGLRAEVDELKDRAQHTDAAIESIEAQLRTGLFAMRAQYAITDRLRNYTVRELEKLQKALPREAGVIRERDVLTNASQEQRWVENAITAAAMKDFDDEKKKKFPQRKEEDWIRPIGTISYMGIGSGIIKKTLDDDDDKNKK